MSDHIRCSVEACSKYVSKIIDHPQCALHRPCNSQSCYDPENCEICLGHWNSIKDGGELAPTSRKLASESKKLNQY